MCLFINLLQCISLFHFDASCLMLVDIILSKLFKAAKSVTFDILF